MRHYDDMTSDFYLARWNSKHIHCGLFEPGEIPEKGAAFAGPDSLTPALERMIEAIVAPAGIEARHHVVDAGCGVGGTAIYLAETRGCRVTGVNLHEGHLQLAKARAKDADVDDRVDFVYGDCSRRLPFDGESIDVVVNVESACHYSDRLQFLREVNRILRPGGQIVVMDWLMAEHASAEQRRQYIEPVCRHWALSGLESSLSFAKLMREAGLTVIENTDFNGKDIGNLRLVENYARTLKGLNFAGLLPERYRPVMQGFVALEQAWQDGCFELGRFRAVKPGGE